MRPVAPPMDEPRRPSATERMDEEAIERALRAGGDHAAADRVKARRERRLTMLPPPARVGTDLDEHEGRDLGGSEPPRAA